MPAYEIVGLARDSKYGDLREAFEPLIYVPTAQDDLDRDDRARGHPIETGRSPT